MLKRRDELLALAPAGLERRRALRYRSDEVGVPLATFDSRDRETIVDLYAWLVGLTDVVAAPTASEEGVQAFLAQQPLQTILTRVHRMGTASPNAARAAILHDLRGGPLLSLVLELSSIEVGLSRARSLTAVALLARDHRKIMRALVADLDAVGRTRDMQPIPHRLSTLVEALRAFPAHAEGGRVAVEVDVDVDLPTDRTIAESCIEFGAIDRIVYNLLNNAVRHADPLRVSVSLLRVGDDLRLVVENGVSSNAREVLSSALEGDRASLFGTFTTSGSGRGLQIVAYLVGSAYGIADVRELVTQGYVGARLQGTSIALWFHWPLSAA